MLPDLISDLVSAAEGQIVSVIFAVSQKSVSTLSAACSDKSSVAFVDLSTEEGEEAALDLGVTSPPEVRIFVRGQLKLALRTAAE